MYAELLAASDWSHLDFSVLQLFSGEKFCQWRRSSEADCHWWQFLEGWVLLQLNQTTFGCTLECLELRTVTYPWMSEKAKTRGTSGMRWWLCCSIAHSPKLIRRVVYVVARLRWVCTSFVQEIVVQLMGILRIIIGCCATMVSFQIIINSGAINNGSTHANSWTHSHIKQIVVPLMQIWCIIISVSYD